MIKDKDDVCRDGLRHGLYPSHADSREEDSPTLEGMKVKSPLRSSRATLHHSFQS